MTDDDADDACTRCGAPDPSNGHTVVLFRFADTDAEDLGALCDRCAFDFQNGFLGKRSGLNCAHCGDREPRSGWARVVSGAPSVWSAIDEDEGDENSDDPICSSCIALVRAYVKREASANG